MYDGYDNILGARLRKIGGFKFSVTGSREGLLVSNSEPGRMMLVTEGATDACAGEALDYYSVGRPNCTGGIPHLQALARRVGVQRIVIVSDLDEPGLRGASMLASYMRVPTSTIVLPSKDLRDFVRAGGTRCVLDALINETIWRQPEAIYQSLLTHQL